MNLLDLVGSLLHRERRRAYEQAVGAELPKLAPPKPSSTVMEEVRGRLAGPGALTFGRLPSGEIVRVKGETSLKSALVIGAPGSGKTRFLLGLLVLSPLAYGILQLRKRFSPKSRDPWADYVDRKAAGKKVVDPKAAKPVLPGGTFGPFGGTP